MGIGHAVDAIKQRLAGPEPVGAGPLLVDAGTKYYGDSVGFEGGSVWIRGPAGHHTEASGSLKSIRTTDKPLYVRTDHGGAIKGSRVEFDRNVAEVFDADGVLVARVPRREIDCVIHGRPADRVPELVADA